MGVSGRGGVRGSASASAARVHPVGLSRLAGAGRREDVGVADAEPEAEEAGGGGDAAVAGVGLLHRVAVVQGVDAHPALIWRREQQLSQPQHLTQPQTAKTRVQAAQRF